MQQTAVDASKFQVVIFIERIYKFVNHPAILYQRLSPPDLADSTTLANSQWLGDTSKSYVVLHIGFNHRFQVGYQLVRLVKAILLQHLPTVVDGLMADA